MAPMTAQLTPPFTAAALVRHAVVFEDAGRLVLGLVLSAHDSSVQVELASGKRQKVKMAQLVFAAKVSSHEAAAQLHAAASAAAQTMDLPLCWECAPAGNFAASHLAQEYFGAQATASEQLATLYCLQQAPHYFRRLGKGQFHKASAEVLAQALAAMEKRRLQQEQIDLWAEQLQAGVCPESVQQALYTILFAPDKNSPAYKAVALAARQSHKGALVLLQEAGALRSAYDFHWQRFVYTCFPKELERGLAFTPALRQAAADALAQAASSWAELPLANVRAFSIDDSSTTEIDDAFSLQHLDSATWTLGIHIAVPSLALQSGSALDLALRARMTTVYFPGAKVTMMPPELVQAFSLCAGVSVPTLSLYCQVDANTLCLSGFTTCIERIVVAANLHHDVLEEQGYAASIAQLHNLQPDLPFVTELRSLYRLAQQLRQQREQVRGKPETSHRPDYQFQVSLPQDRDWPQGDEPVQIRPRLRTSPLDLLVAELMIMANSHWGGWLAQLGLPGIYRCQSSLAPGIKVRMGTRALPHAGIGVPHYAWCTSPLRRYVDFVNQGQIVAAVRYGNAAALKAPFAPRDATLLALAHTFEGVYSTACEFQNSLERYWTLRYLQQMQDWQQAATVLRQGLVRLEALPLVLELPGTGALPRGARILLHIDHIDTFALSASARLLRVLGHDESNAAAMLAQDENEEGAATALAGGFTLELALEDGSAAATAGVDSGADANGVEIAL